MSFQLKPPPVEVLTAPAQQANIPVALGLYLMVGLPLLLAFILLAYRLKPRLKPYAIALILLFTLIPVAPRAHATITFGNPLTTTNIMLFAYYNHTSWTLQDTSTAFVNYTDHGTYYDGYVRVWHDTGGTNYEGSDAYVDCKLRVRSDGYIMAWLDKTVHNESDSIYWGDSRLSPSPIDENSTTPFRAIERVFYVAGETFPEYENLYLYDYYYSSATKLVFINMHKTGTGNQYIYLIVPSANVGTIHSMIIGYGGRCVGPNWVYFQWEGVTFYSTQTNGRFGWFSYMNSSLARDTKYTFKMWNNDAAGETAATILLWLS